MIRAVLDEYYPDLTEKYWLRSVQMLDNYTKI